MSDKSVDLSSTPADSTRLKTKQHARKMEDKRDKRTQEVFKIPNVPNQGRPKHQRIKSIAERKSDLLSRWGDMGPELNDTQQGGGDKCCTNMPTDSVKNSENAMLSLKLARYRYSGREGSINNDVNDEDRISLGESAKMTQAKLKHAQRSNAVTEGSDYQGDEEHDNTSQDEHGNGSDSATGFTDISEAQSNIAEQAEIAERKELEEMKQRIQNDSDIELVLRYVLEKLTMLQIGIKEVKSEQSRISQRINEIEDTSKKNKKVANYALSELQEVAANNFKLVQATIKQDQDITVLKKQMQTCEVKIQKGLMTINGIKKTEDEDIYWKIQDFFTTKMKLQKELKLKTAYRMNKYKVAFQLIDQNDIAYIFSNIKNLKDVKNDDGKFYQ